MLNLADSIDLLTATTIEVHFSSQRFSKIKLKCGSVSFKSLNRVLSSLQDQAGWQEHQRFRHLLQSWPEVVGPLVEGQTRPVAITRHVLKVATSSSVWAQNLAFERHRILEKLNAKLLKPLVDIQFSTIQWHYTSGQQIFSPEHWQHPSQLPGGDEPVQSEVTNSGDQDSAFARWAKLVQRRSHRLPLCPTCQCPTPPGELERWSVCALCAAKQWA